MNRAIGSTTYTIITEFILRHRILVLTSAQLLLVTLSYFLSFAFRFDFSIPHDALSLFLTTLPVLMLCRLAAFYYYGLYTGWWSYVSIQDVLSISKAVLFSSLAFLTCMVFLFGIDGFPRSVLLMDPILLFVLLTGVRVLVRIQHENGHSTKKSIAGTNVLIAGAGNTGVAILNEIRKDHKTHFNPVGFVDDNPYKKGFTIQGLPVLGTCSNIPDVVERFAIDLVLICMPSSPWKELHKIYDLCNKAGIRAKSLPGLSNRLNGGGLFKQLEEVPVNELLGRNTIQFRREGDISLLKKDITGYNVLITGAGGSIGSELARQTAPLKPKTLILYDRNENDLYHLECDMKRSFPEQSIIPLVGDILDEKKCDMVLEHYKPHLIYHAAAYKHVPMMERYPLEAVRNNILGTYLMATHALKHHVPKFILISTDKAVRPSNVMGTTKRLAEMILLGLAGNGTCFISVRFGNVIGSNGSVVPLFEKQIAEGGPVTVTHPEVSRYFMSISEAVQLVMSAGAMGNGGEIFLLDMGKPIKILDLALDLIKRHGLEPGKDIETVFTGLRPGEKLHEELYWEGEGIVPTPNKKITMLKGNGALAGDVLSASLNRLQNYLQALDEHGALDLLKNLVPEATIGNNGSKKEAYRVMGT